MITTKIHGKTYDLTNFNHPGGITPLHLINKNDGTVLFESYHPVSNRKKLQQILSKYEVENNYTINEQQIYDFSDSNKHLFIDEIKKEVNIYFYNLAKQNNCSLIESTKMTFSRKCEIVGLFIFFIFSLIKFINNSLYGLFLMPFSYFLLTVNTYHDISHCAFLTNKTIENLLYPLFYSFQSPYTWLDAHIHIHHNYTNINRLTRLKLYEKNNYVIEYNKTGLFGGNKSLFEYFHNNYILLTIIYICAMLLSLKIMFYNNLIKYGIFRALIFTIIPNILLVLLYIIIDTPSHRHIDSLKYNKNYYIHQVITAYNYNTNSTIIRLLSGGVNCQIEHHLFPSVNSCHLPNIAKIVKKSCLKYNITYNESNNLFKLLYEINNPLITILLSIIVVCGTLLICLGYYM
uniref:Fatty acid desaturase domain-containing protein n=1 Tax=viral metagenome TaxID=1070528 RepID=A0A6C0EJN0_9ZZZZ